MTWIRCLYCHWMLIHTFLCIAPYAVFIELKKNIYISYFSHTIIIYGQIFFFKYSFNLFLFHFIFVLPLLMYSTSHTGDPLAGFRQLRTMSATYLLFTGMASLRHFCYHYIGYWIMPCAHPEYFPSVEKILILIVK